MKINNHLKILISVLSICLSIFSCSSPKEKKTTIQTINPNDIQLSEVVRDTLSKNQIEKITEIHKTFEDLYPVSLEETITNFKRDRNPDNEINIWLNMVNAYKNYLTSKKNNLDLNTKKEVFSLILSRTMMSSEEAIKNSNFKLLTEKEANEVLSYYSEKPIPLEIEKR